MDVNYRNNSAELSRFIEALRKQHASGHLNNVVIRSWASPDGVSLYNERLSERRADSLKAYVVRNAGIPCSIISSQGEGIAWELLRDKVAASDMRYKEEVLNILDNTPVWVFDDAGRIIDGRKKQLMDLHGGNPYKYMQEHFFPELRTSLSVINYQTSGDNTPTVTDGTSSPEGTVALSNNDKETSQAQEVTGKDTTPGTSQKESPANQQQAQGNITDETSKLAASHRLALKTNLLYDAILMPSLEVEYRFHDRWTVNLEGDMAWWHNDRKHKYYQVATMKYAGGLARKKIPGTATISACSAVTRGTISKTGNAAIRVKPRWSASATATCSPSDVGFRWRPVSESDTCTVNMKNTIPYPIWETPTTSIRRPVA